MEDNNGNWNFTLDWIITNDTKKPLDPIFTSVPSGEVTGHLIFDWMDGNDQSGIDYYILIISTNNNLTITTAYILNINTTTSYYKLTEPLSPGLYFYFLSQVDMVGLQSNFVSGSFTVVTPPSTSSSSSTSNTSREDGNFMFFLIILISVAVASFSGSVVVVKRRSQAAPHKKNISLQTIISHINKISSSEQLFQEDKFTQKLASEELLRDTLKLGSMDKLELEQKMNEIQSLGEELFAEGAYFEALQQYKLTEKILLKLGRHEEAFIYSELIIEINMLIEEHDMKLEKLNQEETNDNFIRVFELYYDLFDTLKKLNDHHAIEMYQSNLTEIFQEKKINPAELEFKKSIFEEKATSVFNKNNFEKAAEYYKQCERFSHFLLQIGKEKEIFNIKKFRKKKNECLKKISK